MITIASLIFSGQNLYGEEDEVNDQTGADVSEQVVMMMIMIITMIMVIMMMMMMMMMIMVIMVIMTMMVMIMMIMMLMMMLMVMINLGQLSTGGGNYNFLAFME